MINILAGNNKKWGAISKAFANTHQKMHSNQNDTKNVMNKAITNSMINAENALKNDQYNDAIKYYKFSLRLAQMQFGEHDLIVKNLRLLLNGIDEFLVQGHKKPEMVAEAGWRNLPQ